MPSEIIGNIHRVGEEEIALGLSCGAEADLLSKTLPGISHQDYRVLVMQEVARRTNKPTTKDFAVAKAIVDKALVARGVGVVIPHAQPGRVTR